MHCCVFTTVTSKSRRKLVNPKGTPPTHIRKATSINILLLKVAAAVMFYSENLLSKTGPLARVWLSANLEKKLSKSHVLQSDIQGSVGAIVDQGQAPMALRLSAQLLLGVVRIYSRKTRYLLDDCNEALMKIKMVRTLPSAASPSLI